MKSVSTSDIYFITMIFWKLWRISAKIRRYIVISRSRLFSRIIILYLISSVSPVIHLYTRFQIAARYSSWNKITSNSKEIWKNSIKSKINKFVMQIAINEIDLKILCWKSFIWNNKWRAISLCLCSKMKSMIFITPIQYKQCNLNLKMRMKIRNYKKKRNRMR